MHISGLTIPGPLVATLTIVTMVMLLAAWWAYKVAVRLDRLNVRVDLARGALEAALSRRAVVARLVAAGIADDPRAPPHSQDLARHLVTATDHAERADADGREAAENELSAALARTDAPGRPAALVAELADAETRVMIARRFYNDAVRDTRSLGERRLVRRLHLGGTAPLPQFFEIIER